MINIERKDLPLKSFITIFECKLNDSKMDKDIIKSINEQGDRQGHRTNVKAQMTEWLMIREPGFDKLSNIVLNVGRHISQLKYNRQVNLFLENLWGMKYKSEEIAIEHDHWPALWSFVYYVNEPKDAPGLFFPNMGEQGGERNIEKGLLVFFEGHIRHAVRPKKHKGYRYVVSGNMKEKYD